MRLLVQLALLPLLLPKRCMCDNTSGLSWCRAIRHMHSRAFAERWVQLGNHGSKADSALYKLHKAAG